MLMVLSMHILDANGLDLPNGLCIYNVSYQSLQILLILVPTSFFLVHIANIDKDGLNLTDSLIRNQQQLRFGLAGLRVSKLELNWFLNQVSLNRFRNRFSQTDQTLTSLGTSSAQSGLLWLDVVGCGVPKGG